MPWVIEYISSEGQYGHVWREVAQPYWYDISDDNIGYWNVGTKIAKSNSTMISRWENQFKCDLFMQAKKVLKTKIHDFIPDMQEVQQSITDDEEIEDEFWERENEELCFCYD
jgi:hypothetical protein